MTGLMLIMIAVKKKKTARQQAHYVAESFLKQDLADV